MLKLQDVHPLRGDLGSYNDADIDGFLLQIKESTMKKLLFLFMISLVLGCSKNNKGVSFAEQFADEIGVAPLDYSNMDLWACSSERSDDVCDKDYSALTVEADGSQTNEVYSPATDPGIDCFYIYPTMDWSPNPGNHEDLKDVLMPLSVIEAQAGRFSEVCRVFAPFYRQATLGSYLAESSVAEGIFKKAFLDVATSFEYYLRHWNNGRRMVIMGHSQGAQMASYLLHRYFDGFATVTSIKGSERTDELRARLVVALPIGFNVFTPRDGVKGGTFNDIPLCTSPEETGCVIHYRSYSEGTDFSNLPSALGSAVDNIFAEQGFVNRPFNPEIDVIACVNPSLTPLPEGENGYDRNGNEIQDGDIRLLKGTYLYGMFSGLLANFGSANIPKHIPGRYTATCREYKSSRYLAIGLHEIPGVEDLRGDPINIKSGDVFLGLHLYDYTLALGDLIEQVRIKAKK